MTYLNSRGQSLMMSLDWLSWSGYLVQDGGINTLPEVYCPDTYRLEILDGNNVFMYRAILYDYKGRKCFTMLWRPKSQMIQYNLVQFQIANYWLYNDRLDDIIKLTWQVVDYQFATFNRIDICVDFELTRKRKSILRGLWHNNIACSGKQQGSLFWSKDEDELFPHDFNFGSIQSAVRWKIYNKSKELRVGEEGTEKEYIQQLWIENDMDKYHIWRCEVSVKDFNNFFIDDKPIGIKGDKVVYSRKSMTLADIDNNTIYEVYASLYEKRFKLTKKKHTRRVNDERVYLFSLMNVNIVKPKERKESKNTVDNSIMYKLISIIESDNCKRNESLLQSSCDALYSYVMFNNLDGLFTVIKGKCCEEWCQDMIADCGGGIIRKFGA